MTLKQIFNITIVTIFIVLLGSTIILLDKNSKQETNIEYLRHNLTVKDTKISEMTFSTKELTNFIKDKDTKQKIEIDSILKIQDIKIKNLIKYQKISVLNIDKDTTMVDFKTLKLQNNTSYKREFKMVKKCIKIDGYILTKDTTSTLFITQTENNNRVYITTSFKKTFWDKILFRKGKEVTTIINECGESTLDEINIK